VQERHWITSASWSGTKGKEMATHTATIEWRSDGQFATGKFSRAHQWKFDGGATVLASSSPAVVPPPLSDPAGVDPEEALVASVSSCHMLWFLMLAKNAGLTIESYSDEAEGKLGKDEHGRMAMLSIVLRPKIAFLGGDPDVAKLDALHHEAHDKCFIANSLRTEITVEPR
jgi:organic hydroperoxide reductase OsmC/OhrA